MVTLVFQEIDLIAIKERKSTENKKRRENQVISSREEGYGYVYCSSWRDPVSISNEFRISLVGRAARLF